MKNIITIFVVIASFLAHAQTKHKHADALFDKMWYLDAAKAYEAEIKKGDNSIEVLQRAGDCYYFNTRMDEANKYYERLVSEHPDEVPARYIFRYAQTLLAQKNYTLAKKWMVNYSEKAGTTAKRAKNFSQKEITIDDIVNLPTQFTLKSLSVNTRLSDFGPMYYKERLVYSTSADTSYFHTRTYGWNNQPFLNLQLADINAAHNDIIKTERFSKDINTKYHDACVAFSPDGKTIYFTRNNYEGKLKRDGKGVNNLKLYMATAVEKGKDTHWENIKELPFNSDGYSVGHPSVSSDGKRLYFASDMPGTIGDTDIFVVDILENGKFSEPKNLGEDINTDSRELFPFITDKSLYFATDGYMGLGGLDVFESSYSDGMFGKPVNLGAPLNSNMDDFGYIVQEATNKGFVCSNRKEGVGDDDIYSFERTPIVCTQQIKGYISNAITGERISGASVFLHNTDGLKVQETISQINGEYKFSEPVDCDTNYFVEAQKEKFLGNTKPVLTGKTSGETLVPLGLDPGLIVKEGDLLKIKIGIIFFDLDKSYIRNDAAVELNKVVLLMQEYPNMVIKIEAHTDSRANDNYNLQLSDKRAKATRDYIISQGIAPERIESAIGYGETQLINQCANGIPCTEAQHQLNRRSEFIIVKM